ncbi:MAG: hypothetical protein HDS29_01525 [Bacteroides sp.]|nr:hypothetical protein [Bacteroides sp.]
MPIGIIVWLVLIFIIVLGTVPNFLTMLFCSSAIVISAYFLLRWIGPYILRTIGMVIGVIIYGLFWCVGLGRLFDNSNTDTNTDASTNTNREKRLTPSEAYAKAEREKAIDEWEQKWGRPHPTRINKPLINKKR